MKGLYDWLEIILFRGSRLPKGCAGGHALSRHMRPICYSNVEFITRREPKFQGLLNAKVQICPLTITNMGTMSQPRMTRRALVKP